MGLFFGCLWACFPAHVRPVFRLYVQPVFRLSVGRYSDRSGVWHKSCLELQNSVFSRLDPPLPTFSVQLWWLINFGVLLLQDCLQDSKYRHARYHLSSCVWWIKMFGCTRLHKPTSLLGPNPSPVKSKGKQCAAVWECPFVDIQQK